MPLIRSLTAGTSSLKAHQQRFDVIANNIANVNTIGYKASRANFIEQFNQTFRLGSAPNIITAGGIGGIDPLQIGLGVRLGSVKVDFSQGSIKVTNRPTDLALQGPGFFVVERNGKQLFTRAGAFSFDRDGFLVDSSTGAYVQGYNLKKDSNGLVVKDSNGVNVLDRTLTNIKVPPTFKSAPRQTQEIKLAGNLNASLAAGDTVNPTVTIYDNQGAEHVLRLQFTKSATINQFTLEVFIDGDTANPIPITVGGASATTQTITFNGDGTLSSPLNFTLTAADLNATLSAINGVPVTAFDDTTPKDITVILAEPTDLLGGITQFAAQSTVSVTSQDGYSSGELEKITIDQTGKIIGAFSNGQSELLGQIVIAQFNNPEGLLKEGNNFYSVTPNSGLAKIGTAVEIFPGTAIASGALEESNVDLTEEFTDMIATQRAFQAAARVVTVSDQFLTEITALRR